MFVKRRKKNGVRVRARAKVENYVMYEGRKEGSGSRIEQGDLEIVQVKRVDCGKKERKKKMEQNGRGREKRKRKSKKSKNN